MIPVRENSEVVIIYPYVWYIYVQNWAMIGINVDQYSSTIWKLKNTMFQSTKQFMDVHPLDLLIIIDLSLRPGPDHARPLGESENHQFPNQDMTAWRFQHVLTHPIQDRTSKDRTSLKNMFIHFSRYIRALGNARVDNHQ